MTAVIQLAADAERVYRRLQGAVGGGTLAAASGASTDRRAIAVLTQIMRPQSYRLPVVSPPWAFRTASLRLRQGWRLAETHLGRSCMAAQISAFRARRQFLTAVTRQHAVRPG